MKPWQLNCCAEVVYVYSFNSTTRASIYIIDHFQQINHCELDAVNFNIILHAFQKYSKAEKGNVDVCPVTKETWEARAEAKKADCGGQSVYHCLSDIEGRKWEKCVQRTLVIEGRY